MIAGVFYNRLEENMNLGSDVTTYYAFQIDLAESDLTTKQINTENPYNTRYKDGMLTSIETITPPIPVIAAMINPWLNV